MPNIAGVLKQEIVRISRKEIRTETDRLKKASAAYRAQIADLKRQVSSLQQQIKQLTKASGHAEPATAETDGVKPRWSPVKFKKHRERLGLSAEKFAKLFGVTAQTIYAWERGTRPDEHHLAAISQLRKLTKHQAQAVLLAPT